MLCNTNKDGLMEKFFFWGKGKKEKIQKEKNEVINDNFIVNNKIIKTADNKEKLIISINIRG